MRLNKVILCGASGAGKSSLLLRYADDCFTDSHIATIGVDFKLVRNEETTLQIWDTAGHERFRTLISSFFRGAHAVVMCFDMTDAMSFLALEDHLNDVQRFTANQTPPLIYLAGCKSDLPCGVSEEAARAFVQAHGLKEFFACSAKKNEGIEPMFRHMLHALKDQRNEMLRFDAARKSELLGDTISLEQTRSNKASCCVML